MEGGYPYSKGFHGRGHIHRKVMGGFKEGKERERRERAGCWSGAGAGLVLVLVLVLAMVLGLAMALELMAGLVLVQQLVWCRYRCW